MPRTLPCRLPLLLAGLFVGMLHSAGELQALDIFTLETGGVVEGDWLNRDESPLTHYRVRTGAGVVLSLQLTQVRQTSQQRPALVEYQKMLPTFADTASDQWKLAEWCKVQQLTAERNLHVARVLDLDNKHAGARRALGYVLIDGAWVKHAETRRQDGYELYKGRWRTIQEIELLETTAKRELEEKEWLGKIRRWRRELDLVAKSKEAAEYLSEIRDPVAIAPLVTVMKEDKNRRVKMLFADVLAEMKNSAAERALVSISLSDTDEEIFHYCLDKIVKANPPHIADGYIKALKDTNNTTINRAGIALGRLGDRTAIAPLIAALVTTHSQTVGTANRNGAETYSQSFSSNGTSFKSAEGPKTYIYRVQNQHVLDGLAQLAGGVNFGFDAKSWQYWHAQEKQSVKPGDLDTRRE